MSGSRVLVAFSALATLAAAACSNPAVSSPTAECCRGDGECAEGYRCVEGTCLARCTVSQDCAVGDTCSLRVQACVPQGGIPATCSSAFGDPPGDVTPRDGGSPSDAAVGEDRAITRRDGGRRDGSLEDAGELPDAAGDPDGSILVPDAGRPDAHVECTGTDPWEPNDITGQAFLIDGPLTGVSCNQDEDWFKLPNLAGDDVMALVMTDAPQGLKFQLYEDRVPPLLVAESTAVAGGLALQANVGTSALVRVVAPGPDAVAYFLEASWTTPQFCTPDAMEPNDSLNSAVPLLGNGVAGTICAGDRDWFLLDVPTGDSTVQVDLTPSASAGNLDLSLYLADGTLVQTSGNPQGPESIRVRVMVPSVLALEVRGRPGTAEGAYTLSADIRPNGPACVDDGFEDNDTPATTQAALPINSALVAHLCPADADYFALRFDAPSSPRLVLVTTPGPQVQLVLAGPQGVLAQTASMTGLADLAMPSLPAGAYTVGVLSPDVAAAGVDYQLRLEVSGVCDGDDPYEPNDHLDTPAVYQDPGVAGAVCQGDEDWFVLRTRAGDDVAAVLSVSPVDAVKVELTDSTGRALGTGAAVAGGYMLSATGVPEPVFIHVVGTAVTAVNYRLQATATSPQFCTADAFEINDSFSAARPLPGGAAAASICPADVDWFRLDVPAGEQVVTVDLQPAGSAGNLDVALVGPDGMELARGSNPVGVAEHLEVRVATAGGYGLRVWGAATASGETSQGGYVLSAAVTPVGPTCAQDDIYEENDTASAARFVLPANAAVPAFLCSQDPDYFLLQVGTDGVAEVSVRHRQTGVETVLTLGRGGQVLHQAQTAQSENRFRVEGLPAGTYEVGLSATGDIPGGGLDYTITAFQAPCTGADAQEPNNDATQSAGVPLEGAMGVTCNDDLDWFAVDSAPGDQLSATLTSASAPDLQFLALDAVTLTPLLDSTLVPGARILSAQSVPGPVLLLVVSRGALAATYTLEATHTPPTQCQNDGYEPNEWQAAARRISVGALSATICEQDQDWFAINVDRAGTTIRVDLTAASATEDLDTKLHGPDGMEVAFGNLGPGLPEHMVYTAPVPGTYAIHVYGFPEGDPAAARSAYTLAVALESQPPQCVDDSYEENDTPGDARTVLPANGELSAQLCPADPDYFLLQLDRSGQAALRLTWPAGFTTRLSVFRDGFPVASVEGNTGVLSLPVSGAPQQVLAVAVESPDVAAAGMAYTLTSATQLCTGADAFEPNNSATAAKAYVNPSVAGVSCSGDEDWFYLDVAAGETVNAVATATGGTLDVLQVCDRNGAVLADSTLINNTRVAVARNVSGRVLVRVVSNAGQSATYSLQVSHTNPNQCVPDAFEPNETQATAKAYTAPLTAQVCANDQDWFSFTVTQAGSQVTVRMVPDPTAGDLDMRLHGPNGSILGTSELPQGQPERIVVTAPEVGTYAVHIYGWPEAAADAGQGAYLLGVDVTPPGQSCSDDAYEDNDDLQSPYVLGVGSQDLVAHLCPGDDDYYGVFLDSGGTLDVTVTYPAPPRLRLTLMDSQGTRLAESDTGSGVENVHLDGLRPDLYLLRLQGPRTPVAGRDYVLSIRATGPECTGDIGEPNDDMSAATPAACPGTTSAVACTSQDLDYYVVTPAVNQALELTLTTPENPEGPLDAVILAPDGSTVLTGTYLVPPGAVRTVRADIRRLGSYYIQVYNNGVNPDDQAIPYTLSLTELPGLLCQDDRYEENDGPIEAAAVRSGVTSAVACPADGEWFAYDFRANTAVTILLTTTNDPDASLDLVAPNGADVLAAGYANWQPITYMVRTAGRYFVRVTYYNLAETGDTYTLTVTP